MRRISRLLDCNGLNEVPGIVAPSWSAVLICARSKIMQKYIYCIIQIIMNKKKTILIIVIGILGILILSILLMNVNNNKVQITDSLPECKKDCSFSIGYLYTQKIFSDDNLGDITVKGYDIPWENWEENKDSFIAQKIINKEEIPEVDIVRKLDIKSCSFMSFSFENVPGLTRRSCE